ncbi:MAG: hypothetical protein PHN52_07375 [candidate division Zixibacteria bacterium]|nr:hypothetical protein [candidate division Zixibacteria bacterium]
MKKIIYAGILILCLVSISGAQVEQGDKEIQVQGSLIAFEGMTVILVNFIYGKFITPNVELGGGPMVIYASSGDDDDSNISLTLFGRYNFVTGEKIVPYLSSQIYQFDISPEEPADFIDYTFLQVGGGLKYFVSDNLAYDVSGNLGIGLGGGDVSFIIYGGLSAFF